MRTRRGNLISKALLILIAENPVHGYELVSKLNEIGMGIPPGVGQMGRIYRFLSDMENDGLISFEWDVSTSPPRKVYKITRAGLRYLGNVTNVLEDEIEILEKLLSKARKSLQK